MSEASGLVLSLAAGAMVLEPALVNLLAPGSALYALLVLSRKTTLPLRLPMSARTKDYNYPSPVDRSPRRAAGTIYLGRDLKGRELWLSSDDGRQHATVPGTTGAGKTTALVGFLTNALAHGSGFVLVDGKADNKLFGEILALARRFGREDDVLCLNFMTASGEKQSNTFNPFAIGNADAIGEMLSSQLGETTSGDSNQVFRDRAVALVGTLSPALVWMRDNKGVSLNIETIRQSFELRCIWKVAVNKVFEFRDPATGETQDIDVSDIPEDVIYPLRAYLGELPAYDMSLPWNKQKTEEPSKQHGFAVFYFTRTFELLGVSLGHIFKVQQSEVDMRDVVLNRRILVVNLPALESSDVLRALAPDARQVSLVAEAFGIDEPDWIIRDRADAEMWANVATRTDLPADAARRRAALEAMLKPFVKEAARLCRKSREDARRSDEAAGKLLAARNEGGYWLDALEDALTSRTYAWARGLIEAYEACQEAFGAERAIGIAIRGERWAPVDHDKDVEVLLLAAAR
ncbi:hypothetical protein M2322_004778 [Rhodoblastus acidophilus]|uniref:hypothetical protein n=1 Tax=Rhodoblastus acidophilus TaxID=1074 RepID=UPI0022258150|nr:hypothetical protein [Rhodoblastus acidophilus]MCW2319209.1 hypothetical protein [Rhodoblastus acidophilus]